MPNAKSTPDSNVKYRQPKGIDSDKSFSYLLRERKTTKVFIMCQKNKNK